MQLCGMRGGRERSFHARRTLLSKLNRGNLSDFDKAEPKRALQRESIRQGSQAPSMLGQPSELLLFSSCRDQQLRSRACNRA